MNKKNFLILLFNFSLFFFGAFKGYAQQPANDTNENNVILITLDGVRWQEFFYGSDPSLSGRNDSGLIFENLWKSFIPEGALYGSPTTASKVNVANPHFLSLPAYQSIFAGSVRNCIDNNCSRVDVETFPERLVRELGLRRSQVAGIASWNKLALAFENKEGSTFVNAGLQNLRDPESGEKVTEFEDINKLQNSDSPNWSDVRFDKHTFAHSLLYLIQYRPRFLYISMNDSDEYAHMGAYDKYVGILRQHDEWLKILFKTLTDLGEYGKRTTVIVTTDHGRGDSALSWRNHGPWDANCKKIWLFAKGPYTAKTGSVKKATTYSHLNIRPTVETLLGLKPCNGCEAPLPEVVQGMTKMNAGVTTPNAGASHATVN